MPSPRIRLTLPAILLALCLIADVAHPRATQSGDVNSAQNAKPRLVLVIVVDQFRYDYLDRFSDLFGSGGLKRLMSEGAFWTNANYDYIPTKTAPGHSAILSGASPSGTGMVANEWVERSTNGSTGRKVTSVGDDTARVLGGGPNESAYSPRRLLASTVGDELRLATNDRAKVIGISDKPRAAILPAGRRANAAYWLSSDVGTAISSNYYFKQLPAWVEEFNRTRPLDKYFGARWERLLPEAEYLKHAGPDTPSWENIDDAPGETNTFPHIVTGGSKKPGTPFYDALDHSPFVNDVLVALAKTAISNEELGADEVTDLLSVSLSGNDHVGHRFGPLSQEVMDVTLRLDGQIKELLDFVDGRVGLGNTLVVFTSDHGVAPLLDWIVAQRLGRGGIRQAEVLTAIRSAISSHYNSQLKSPDPTADYILTYRDKGETKDAMVTGNIYFNLAALKRDGVQLDEITKLAGEAALKVPGIARYFTRGQLEACQIKTTACSSAKTDPISQMAARGFNRERSGDLVIVTKPFNHLSDSSDPANHGSPYSYDTHVPLIIMGNAFRAGNYRQTVAPTDIAPTLSSVLGLRIPNRSQGRILREALKTR